MVLFKLEFTFNLTSIIALLSGIVSGVLLTILFYFLYILLTLKKQEVNLHDINNNITTDQINLEIKQAQTTFLKTKKEKGQISFDTLREICFNLMNDIASLYYPNSKHPLTELTFKEMILLDEYLVNKLDNLLNKVGLKSLKKMRVSKALEILNMKKSIDNNPVVKTTKNVSSFSSKFFSIINVINPAMWIKRGIVTPSINFIIKKICLLVISTVGQETYHIYSKQAFLDPVMDQEVEELIKIIERDYHEEATESTTSIEMPTRKKKKDKIRN